MELLSPDRLERSPVVANNRMNRERNAIGINSYERDILLSPIEFLSAGSLKKNSIHWLDICCGQAKALIQTAQHLNIHFPHHHLQLVGIDLVDMHDPVPEDCGSVSIITGSFSGFTTSLEFDLITCVHGLHYLGDKLGAIQKACSLLTPAGLLVANLDIHNLKKTQQKNFQKEMTAWFRANELEYDSRKHLLRVHGKRSLTIPFNYLGADDQAGPNYTGQEVVNSYYE